MTISEFTQLTLQDVLSLPKALQALWYDKQGNWDKAHRIVQSAKDGDSAWVHAYLHRKEGDTGNARYWYRRTGRSEFTGDLNQEWEQLASDLLGKIQTGADTTHKSPVQPMSSSM